MSWKNDYDYRSWAAPHSPLILYDTDVLLLIMGEIIVMNGLLMFLPHCGDFHMTASYKGVWAAYWTIITWCMIHGTVLYWLLMEQSIYNGIVNWSAVVLFLQVSFGPISWLMVSEIFPLRTRGRALSIAVLLNFAANAVVTFAFSPLQVCVLKSLKRK